MILTKKLIGILAENKDALELHLKHFIAKCLKAYLDLMKLK